MQKIIGILTGVVLIIVFFFLGSLYLKKPTGYPNFSTPENAFHTHFYALRTRDHDVLLDSLTEEYKQLYGKTEHQQNSLMEHLKHM